MYQVRYVFMYKLWEICSFSCFHVKIVGSLYIENLKQVSITNRDL